MTARADPALGRPARTGAMLVLVLQLPDRGTIVSSNAEVAELAKDRIRFDPGIGRVPEVSFVRTAQSSPPRPGSRAS